MLFNRRIDKLTDKELIARYKQKGDKELIGILYKRYTRFVFAVCMKYLNRSDLSEDAVMAIFEKLFDDLKTHNVENVKSWIYTVAKNHCLHELRKSKTHQKYQQEKINSGIPFMENALNMYHDNDNGLEIRIKQMEQELLKLSEEQRVCIELFYLKEKSYRQVAVITGYTLNQVKSFIQNGKRNLKNTLSDYGQ